MSNQTPPNTKKIFFAEVANNEEMKKLKEDYCKKYNINKIKKYSEFNTYLYNINHQYFLIDCDDKNAYKYVKSLINKYEITNPMKTKSISNIYNTNEEELKITKYKHHYYFKNNLNITNDKSIGHLEMFVNKLIFEDAEQFNKNINLNDLPELPQDFIMN